MNFPVIVINAYKIATSDHELPAHIADWSTAQHSMIHELNDLYNLRKKDAEIITVGALAIVYLEKRIECIKGIMTIAKLLNND